MKKVKVEKKIVAINMRKDLADAIAVAAEKENRTVSNYLQVKLLAEFGME